MVCIDDYSLLWLDFFSWELVLEPDYFLCVDLQRFFAQISNFLLVLTDFQLWVRQKDDFA